MASKQSAKQTLPIKNILKPWTKETLTKCWDWCSPMLDEDSLNKLYKCMGSYCSFNTNDTSAMISHLHGHDDSVDILKCSYCVAKFKEINDLIAHIKSEHGQCRYQCSYCFYRSLDAANVLNHHKIYHKEYRSAEKSILELPKHHEIPRVDYMSAAIRGKVRQKILKCTVCHKQFLAISSYIQHIKLVHCETVVSCCWCLKEIVKDNAAAHLLTHYIGTYECLYCDYACNIKQMMQRHLGNVHATKPLFCSKRREITDAHQPKKKYLLDLREMVPAEFVKSLDDGPKNTIPKSTSSVIAKANETEMQIPKILNVQGGINVTNDGVILAAKQSLPSTLKFTKSSFSNEEVNIVPASNVHVKRRADSITIGRIKQARLDPSVQKLYTNSSITLTKTSNVMQSNARTLSASSNVANTREVGGNQCFISTSLPRSISYSTDSGIVKHQTYAASKEPFTSRAMSMVANSTENSSENFDRFEQAAGLVEHEKSVAFSYHYNLYDIRKKTSPISFRLAEFHTVMDTYYRHLSFCLNETKKTPRDINVCSIGPCGLHFEDHDKLFEHLKKRHGVITMETPFTIICNHCALQVNNISNYFHHLSVHSLNQYACFLCCYQHFLLPSVVNHMNVEHNCTSVQLSFAHPVKQDILSDIILVMPGTITWNEKQKYIQETINLGEQLMRQNKPTKQPIALSTAAPIALSTAAPIALSTTVLDTANARIYPKQSHYSLLYKCGLCQSVETSKLSFQKHLIEECPNKKRNVYVCAHCNKIYRNWTKNPDKIFEHLYYHGENLYGCGSCPYYHFLFENVAMHVKTASHPPKCAINVLRESADQWECNVCQLKSPFRQTIMEHMQNVHDLPGERFMCSLCNFRTLTQEQSIKHFKQNHPNQDVVMIEMYHETEKENSSNNEDTDSDASSDVEIVNDVIESYSISSTSDHMESDDDMQTDFDKEAIDNDQKLINTCPVLREHNYCKTENVHENAKVKIENCTKKTDITPELCTGESFLAQSNQPSIRSSVDTAVEDSHPALVDSNDALNNTAVQEDDVLTTERELQQSLSPTTVLNGLSTERRASKRVAVKKDATCRWNDCTKYGCIFCDNSFVHYKSLHIHSRIVHATISKNFLHYPNNDTSQLAGTFIGFRLLSIARCFYCDKQDTCSALRMHHDKKHEGKTFICLDYWNAFKCGLCAYLNGSGNEKEFSNHFQQFHSDDKKYMSPFDHIDDTFIQWAMSLGKKLNLANNEVVKAITYICGTCSEKYEDESSLGKHVARHILKFNCNYCEANFKDLGVLYDHVLMLHRKEDYVPPPTVPIISDQELLEVQMCFMNGFILSKREAQFTSYGSLQLLEEGYHQYYEDQIKDLESFKTYLSTPISTSSQIEDNTTCKSFLLSQKTCPILKILPVHVDNSEDDTACRI